MSLRVGIPLEFNSLSFPEYSKNPMSLNDENFLGEELEVGFVFDHLSNDFGRKILLDLI